MAMFYNGDMQALGSGVSVDRGSSGAYVKIVEQPVSKIRFRYECETSVSTILGVSSAPGNKTFPTIQIIGCTRKAVVVVSCVTKDPPHRPHPHGLMGREDCKQGVCVLEIPPGTTTVPFSKLCIQCVKRKDIAAALKLRKDIGVDPFRTGYSHQNQPYSINLSVVRLCFQVLLEDEWGKFTVPLTPVVSNIIYDKKAICKLGIVKLSDCACPVDGGRKDIILLCEKVAKEDIQVRFFEEKDDHVAWEAFGDFQPSQVHKQTAIWFRPPRYHTLEVTEPVRVFIQLRRPSDGATSEPLPFEYLPLDSVLDYGKRKRLRLQSDTGQAGGGLPGQESHTQMSKNWNIPIEAVAEPRAPLPPPYAEQTFGSPIYGANVVVSPQCDLSMDPLVPRQPQPLQVQRTIQQQHPVRNVETPSTSAAGLNDLNRPSTLSSLMNLDSQLMPQVNLDSQELAAQIINLDALSDTLSSICLADGGAAVPD